MIKFYPTEEQIKKISHALFSQGKIYAIKECRQITGWGLKDAKDAVELYAYQIHKKAYTGNQTIFPFDFSFGNAPDGKSEAELVIPETTIGLSSLVIRLTGNRTAELNESDKIDIITPEGAHRFSIDELRTIVKFFDATRITNN